jgi:SAM-dependent MidA family methyltransferase
VGPLFGAVVARAVDTWWDDLGRPDPFVVIEAGAGTGTLARSVLAAAPRCAAALRYVLVERSSLLRQRQGTGLELELPAFALGPVQPAAEDDDEQDPRPVTATGPLVTSLAEFPAQPFPGVVIANELLDNLAFTLAERWDDGWAEVRVGEEGGRLVELSVPASPELTVAAERAAPDAPAGGRVPLQHAAQRWLRDALAAVPGGRVVVIDYGDDTPSLARRPWRDWVRTYRGHGRGGHPLDGPGSQDVTCEVAFDQLVSVRAPVATATQAEFLTRHGIEALVDDARRAWSERAAIGDLAAVTARSRVNEAAALTDPAGLGGFTVIEWTA